MKVRIQPCPRAHRTARPDGAPGIVVLDAAFDPAQDFELVSVYPALKTVSIVREIEAGQFLGRDKKRNPVRVSAAGRVTRLSPLDVSRIDNPRANGHDVEMDRKAGTTTIVDLASGQRTTLDLLSQSAPEYDAARGAYYLRLDDGGGAAIEAEDYSIRWVNPEIKGRVIRRSHPDLLLFYHFDLGVNLTVYAVVDKASGRILHTQNFSSYAPIPVEPSDAVSRVWGQMLETNPRWAGSGPAPKKSFVVAYDWVTNTVDKKLFPHGRPQLVREERALYALSGEVDVGPASSPNRRLYPNGLRVFDPDSLVLRFEQDLPGCVLLGDVLSVGEAFLLNGFAPPDWSEPGDAVELLVTFAQHPAEGDVLDVASIPLSIDAPCEASDGGETYRVRYTGDSTRFFDVYAQLAVGLKQTAQRHGYFKEMARCVHHNPKFTGRLLCDVEDRVLTPLQTQALEGMFRKVEQSLADSGYVSGRDRASGITIALARSSAKRTAHTPQ